MDRDTPIQNIAFFGEAGACSTRGPANKLLRQEHDNCCWRMNKLLLLLKFLLRDSLSVKAYKRWNFGLIVNKRIHI